jgi:hypothetical protein
MGTPMDWKNVEVTLYAKVNDASGTKNGGQHFELMARGGPAHGNPVCEGTSMHANTWVGNDRDGETRIEKELSHTDGYAEITKDTKGQVQTGDLMGKWIGMKGVFYNTKDGNVKSELWLDKKANNDWGTKPVLTVLDNGNWTIKKDKQGNQLPNECKGKINEKITWGGPVSIFRWDNFQDVDIKLASVREIIPPK